MYILLFFFFSYNLSDVAITTLLHLLSDLSGFPYCDFLRTRSLLITRSFFIFRFVSSCEVDFYFVARPIAFAVVPTLVLFV